MKEKDVVRIVEGHFDDLGFYINHVPLPHEKGYFNRPDVIVYRTIDIKDRHPIFFIECKGSSRERSQLSAVVDRAIGQCLRYNMRLQKLIYLALPNDVLYLEELADTLNYHKLIEKIRIVLVNEKGIIDPEVFGLP